MGGRQRTTLFIDTSKRGEEQREQQERKGKRARGRKARVEAF
ncbi:hypothetical protein [Aeropyrum camini]|nr:hypothetical protein [Aeropyrum camini]